jgi:hypothetical protein
MSHCKAYFILHRSKACCSYINQSGIVSDAIKRLKKALPISDNCSSWANWMPWVLPLLGSLIFFPHSVDCWTLSFSNPFSLCFPSIPGIHSGHYPYTDQLSSLPPTDPLLSPKARRPSPLKRPWHPCSAGSRERNIDPPFSFLFIFIKRQEWPGGSCL